MSLRILVSLDPKSVASIHNQSVRFYHSQMMKGGITTWARDRGAEYKTSLDLNKGFLTLILGAFSRALDEYKDLPVGLKRYHTMRFVEKFVSMPGLGVESVEVQGWTIDIRLTWNSLSESYLTIMGGQEVSIPVQPSGRRDPDFIMGQVGVMQFPKSTHLMTPDSDSVC